MVRNLADWAPVQGPLPMVTCPSPAEFATLLGKPFVLTGALEIDAPDKWAPERIKAEIGANMIRAYISADGAFPGGLGPYDESKYKLVEITISECIDRMHGHVVDPCFSPEEKCYLYQVSPESFGCLLEGMSDPIYVADREVQSKNVWMSGEGNITPIHYDASENLLAQIRGRKTVLVWDPSQYERLQLNPFGSAHDRQSRINVFEPEDCFTTFDESLSFKHELSAGQILHIPYGWPHYVYTEEFSVSVNYWWALEGLASIHDAILAAGEDATKLDGVVKLASELFSQRRPKLVTFFECLRRDGSLEACARFLAEQRAYLAKSNP